MVEFKHQADYLLIAILCFIVSALCVVPFLDW